MLADGRAEAIRVVDGGDHVVPGVLEEPAEALAEQDLVFGDHHPHGSSAVTTVPRPGGLSTVSVPPSAATRSLMPASPEPSDGRAPPTPSSRTRRMRLPFDLAALTTTSEAPACLAAFASASLATK